MDIETNRSVPIVDQRTEYYFKVYNDVIDSQIAEIGVHAFAVYCLILRSAVGRGRAAPSRTAMANRLGLSRPTINKAITTLITAKMIRVEKQIDDIGSQLADLIVITDEREYVQRKRVNDVAPPINGVYPPLKGDLPSTLNGVYTPVNGIDGTVNAVEPFKDSKTQRQKESTNGPELQNDDDYQKALDAFQEQLRRETKTKRPTRTKAMRDADKSFRDFIGAYPLQMSIEDARAEWGHLTGEERALAIAAIRVQRTWPHMTGDPQYIPRAHTWLRKRLWTDRLGAGDPVPDFVFPEWFKGGWPKVKEMQAYRKFGKPLPDNVNALLDQIDAQMAGDLT